MIEINSWDIKKNCLSVYATQNTKYNLRNYLEQFKAYCFEDLQ